MESYYNYKMVSEEIIGGLKNAMEHGYSIEQAIQSFINAGYSSQDVQEAAASLRYGAMQIMQPIQQAKPMQPVQQMSTPPIQTIQIPVPIQSPASVKLSLLASMDTGTKILVFGVFGILILVFGALALLFFRSQL